MNNLLNNILKIGFKQQKHCEQTIGRQIKELNEEQQTKDPKGF